MVELLCFNSRIETSLVVDHVLVLVKTPERKTGLVDSV